MKTIACLGSGSGVSGDSVYEAMVEVGRLLAMCGCTVITGGFGGTGMEAPAKGATKAGGKAIGYVFLGKKGNPYLSSEVDCGKQFLNSTEELSPEIQYGIRLGNLLSADGFIIAAHGGPGTMVELLAIINLNRRLWKGNPKRFAILKVRPGDDGWDMAMFDMLEKWGILPREIIPLLLIAETPAQATEWVCS